MFTFNFVIIYSSKSDQKTEISFYKGFLCHSK